MAPCTVVRWKHSIRPTGGATIHPFSACTGLAGTELGRRASNKIVRSARRLQKGFGAGLSDVGNFVEARTHNARARLGMSISTGPRFPARSCANVEPGSHGHPCTKMCAETVDGS